MANILFLLSFSGYVLLGMLSRPCAAVNGKEVNRLEVQIGSMLESERVRQCNVCTYICPRLFNRIQERGILSIYENKEADTRASIEPFITPLLKPLKSHPGDSITSEDCQEYCSPPAKIALMTTLEGLSPTLSEVARDEEIPFARSAFELATQRIFRKVEADANLIYGCKDNIEGRSEAYILSPSKNRWDESAIDFFQKEYSWE